MIYAWVGDVDSAMERLVFLAKTPGGPDYGQLKFDPAWDAVRREARFAKMLDGLRPESGRSNRSPISRPFSRPSPKANAGQCDANARSVCARQVSSPRGQFDQFTKDGAIGSHLENLKRKGGFKGFNQHAISLIISETDPRKQKSFAGA
jgi:hypothetical protein